LKKKIKEVVSLGFPVQGTNLSSEVKEIFTYEVNQVNPDQLEITKETAEAVTVEYESLSLNYEYPTRGHAYRMVYEDPFKVIAGRFLARDLGNKVPELLVWPGDGVSIIGEIPSFVLKKLKTWNGPAKNSIRFASIKGPETKLELLMNHTHWGVRLMKLINDNKVPIGDNKKKETERLSLLVWAKTLYNRIKALLKGHPDPIWYGRKIYSDETEIRSEKSRAVRFLECLKTADGIFLQSYIAVPEANWSWEKFDLTVLKNLSCLIGDEFFDGDIKEIYHDTTMRYTELKRSRKTFKMLSNLNKLEAALQDVSQRKSLVVPWLRFMLPIWDYTRGIKEPIHLAYVDGILNQSRGAGQPPDMIKMQSKRKFLKTVSQEPPKMSDTSKKILEASISKLNDILPEEIFTGLDTKARISLNANACWEKTRADGGTVEAIAEIVTTGHVGEPAYVRDLFTGEVEGILTLNETNTGTYIFWRCLDTVLKSSPSNLRKAALVMISEPGKARTVTKASAPLKVVLDVINKICSYPLSKIESSMSGMSKSSHAWNTFRKGWTPEGKDFVFAEEKVSTKARPDGSRTVEKTYRDLWLSSTDYSEATDKLRHEVAKPIADYWMSKCGIPPLLQMIVRGTCFVPREIVFEAHGSMSKCGEEWNDDSPFENPRFVILRQGVLMGDPLTKVILHLVNILVRITGENYSNPSFIRDIFPWDRKEVKEYVDSYCSDKVTTEMTFTQQFPFEGQSSYSTPEPVEMEISTKIGITPKIDKSYITGAPVIQPKPNPISFELSDKWLRNKLEIQVKSGETYRTLKVREDFKLEKQQTPAADRVLNMKCAEIKHAILAHKSKIDADFALSNESLKKEIIRNGFKWNPLPDAEKVTNNVPRTVEEEQDLPCSIL
jgi:hypothetical protein